MTKIGRAIVSPGGSQASARGEGFHAWRLRAIHAVVLALWCGLIAGSLEVVALVVRKHTVDLNKFYWISRHFVWLIPLTDLLIFFTIGLGLAVLYQGWPRGTSWLGARLLCVLTLVAPFWAAFPRVYGPAGLLLAVGVSARLVPVFERHSAGFRRAVILSFPVLAIIAALPAASIWAGDWLAERREAARALPRTGAANVVLIVLDTVAADHLSLHGYDRPTSPTLESLARRGVRFDRVQATSSWTLPSHAGFFTGRWPHELSAGWLTPLDASHPTLAEFLGSRGYATAGFVANLFYCGSDSGLARGFTRYRDFIFPELSATKPAALVDRPVEGLRAIHQYLTERASVVFLADVIRLFDAGIRKPAAAVNRELLGWLSERRQPERPFFAFVNFCDVHYPYMVSAGGIHRFGAKPRTNRETDIIENWRVVDKLKLSAREIAFARDSYDDCIADLDEQLGRLLDELERRGILESTWLLITSDHGESFGEQPGVFIHGTSLYQPQLHVPLVIVPPSASPPPARKVVSELVSLRDLPATIVDLLGVETGAPFPGQSLSPLWNGLPAGESGDPQGPPVSPAVSQVVPTNPHDPDPAKLVENRRAWASLATGDSIYIRIRQGDADHEELFDLHADPRQIHNLASDPGRRSILERMRTTLEQVTAGPLTPERFPL
jgi:arylsulfatase A-like enzyme